MNNYQNPFTGSKIEIKKRITEDDLPQMKGFNGSFNVEGFEIEDHNERYVLYTNGILVKKTKSEKSYFKK